MRDTNQLVFINLIIQNRRNFCHNKQLIMSLFQPAYLKNKAFSKSNALQINLNNYEKDQHHHEKQSQLGKNSNLVTPKNCSMVALSKSQADLSLSSSKDKRRFNRTIAQKNQSSQSKRALSRKSSDIFKTDRNGTSQPGQSIQQQTWKTEGSRHKNYYDMTLKQLYGQTVTDQINNVQDRRSTRFKSDFIISKDEFNNQRRSNRNFQTSYIDKCKTLQNLVGTLRNESQRDQTGHNNLGQSGANLEKAQTIKAITLKANQNISRIKSSSLMQQSKCATTSSQKLLKIQRQSSTQQTTLQCLQSQSYPQEVQSNSLQKLSVDSKSSNPRYIEIIVQHFRINSLKKLDKIQFQKLICILKQHENHRLSQQHQIVSLKKTIENINKKQKLVQLQKQINCKKQEVNSLSRENYRLKKQLQGLKMQIKTNAKRVEDQSQQIMFLQKQVSQLTKHINKVMACKIPKQYIQLQSYRQASLEERLKNTSLQLKKSVSEKQKQLEEQNQFLKNQLERVRSECSKLQISVRVYQKRNEQLNVDKNAMNELSYLRPKYKKLDQQCKILKRNNFRLQQDLQFQRKRNRRNKMNSRDKSNKISKNVHVDFSNQNSQDQQDQQFDRPSELKSKRSYNNLNKIDRINEHKKTDDEESFQLNLSYSR